MQDGLVFNNPGTPNEKLWQAVIDSAIADWVRGPHLHKSKAEFFLFQDEVDFPFVCRAAGLDPERVREVLWTIRAQSVCGSERNVA
jgi:hypothetical protein